MPYAEGFGRAFLLGCVFVVLTADVGTAQPTRHPIDGLWSDPPATPEGELCSGWCTDAGLAHLNKLLDDPANDTRPFVELQAEALRFQRETYIRPRLTDTALRYYPLDPADDPSFLRC